MSIFSDKNKKAFDDFDTSSIISDDSWSNVILIDEEYMIELLNDINDKNPMNEGNLDTIVEISEDVDDEKMMYSENDLQVKLNFDKNNSKCYKLPMQNINII